MNRYKVEFVKQLEDTQVDDLSAAQLLLYNFYLSQGVLSEESYEFAVDGPYSYAKGSYSYLLISKAGDNAFRMKYDMNGNTVW